MLFHWIVTSNDEIELQIRGGNHIFNNFSTKAYVVRTH